MNEQCHNLHHDSLIARKKRHIFRSERPDCVAPVNVQSDAARSTSESLLVRELIWSSAGKGFLKTSELTENHSSIRTPMGGEPPKAPRMVHLSYLVMVLID